MADDINKEGASVFNVRSDGGIFYVAPKGTTMPTEAKTAMTSYAAFMSLGDIDEDGFTDSTDVKDGDSFKDINGDEVLATAGGKTRTVKVKFIEPTRLSVLKSYFGEGNVERTGADTTIDADTKPDSTERCFVADEVLSNGVFQRTCIARGITMSYDDVSHSKGDLMAYGMTIKCVGGFKRYQHDPSAETASTGTGA